MTDIQIHVIYYQLSWNQRLNRRNLKFKFIISCLILYYYGHHLKDDLLSSLSKNIHLHLFLTLMYVISFGISLDFQLFVCLQVYSI